MPKAKTISVALGMSEQIRMFSRLSPKDFYYRNKFLSRNSTLAGRSASRRMKWEPLATRTCHTRGSRRDNRPAQLVFKSGRMPYSIWNSKASLPSFFSDANLRVAEIMFGSCVAMACKDRSKAASA